MKPVILETYFIEFNFFLMKIKTQLDLLFSNPNALTFCRSFEGNINELTEAALDEIADMTMNCRKCVVIFHYVFLYVLPAFTL